MNLYNLMSSIEPATGGDFKLLYGNREKIDSASGLAIWVYDDTINKPENIKFTETLNNTKNGYIRNIEPSTGNDFKLLYGNRRKITFASEKSKFVFGANIIPGIKIIETQNGTCDFGDGSGGCISTGIYEIVSDVSQSNFIYAWKILNGNAEIISDSTNQSVIVQVDKYTTDQNFLLECNVYKSEIMHSIIDKIFTHIKREVVIVSIESLIETSNISCIYENPTPNTCEAISTYEIITDGSPLTEIMWTISNNSEVYIKDGQGTKTITIGSDNRNITENFILSVEIKNDDTSDTMSGNFIHQKIQRDSIKILTLNETNNLSCIYYPSGSNKCISKSTYSITIDNSELPTDHITWTVDNSNISIVSGQGTDTIMVSSEDNVNQTDFIITANVFDAYTSDTKTISATHYKSEYIPMSIISINEISSGSCIINDGDTTCVAESEYGITTGPIDYNEATILWTIVGNGIITSDSDAVQVTVQSVSGSDATFTLTATIDDGTSSDSMSETYTHYKDNKIVITSLNELVSGSCHFIEPDTCIAESHYKIVSSNTDTYLWEVIGNVTFTEVSGHSDEIIVTSDSKVTESFNVKCTVSNTLDSETINQNYNHIKSDTVDKFYQHVTYDINNIDTEFFIFDSGLIVNGTFIEGIDGWIVHSGAISWESSKEMMKQTGGYTKGSLTENVPSGSSITVSFTVDTLGDSAGYCDIYQGIGSTASNWQKVYYTVDAQNICNVSHTFTTDDNIMELLWIDANHSKPCLIDNVSVVIN